MKRILVVEDQIVLREFITRLIESIPFLELIGETGDGHEAYQMAAKQKPDMVILDVMLPGLNGVGVLRRLKQMDPDILVLAFSAFPSPHFVSQMMEAGANGLVQKSENLDVLEKAIEHVAGGKTYYSPNVSEMLRDMMLNPTKVNSIDKLSAREKEILQLVAESHSNKEIAERLHISIKTAETHRNNIITKLDIHDIAGLTRYAIANGLVSLEAS